MSSLCCGMRCRCQCLGSVVMSNDCIAHISNDFYACQILSASFWFQLCLWTFLSIQKIATCCRMKHHETMWNIKLDTHAIWKKIGKGNMMEQLFNQSRIWNQSIMRRPPDVRTHAKTGCDQWSQISRPTCEPMPNRMDQPLATSN